jgi:transcriptional antiterminator NusG
VGKVDELAVNTDTRSQLRETIKVVDGPLMVSMVQLKKINEEKRKLEVMVKIRKKNTIRIRFMQVEKV